ncbi:hypothetical protein [Kitasatospora sp. KL5]|uniref:hypothetical protein n=1 Tax=Kitasatospora sp. KL5 TaxID=3425125 RepID=UPI003D6DDD09
MTQRYGPSGGGGGCAALLLLPGWFIAGYFLALPAVLPAVMDSSPEKPHQGLHASQLAVLWAISALTALLLAWMAGGRGRPKPVVLLVHTAVIGAAAAAAVVGASMAAERLAADPSLGDAATRDAARAMLIGVLGTVAAGIAAAVAFYVLRGWGRRTGYFTAPVRPRTTPAAGRRPAPGEVWLAHVPLREDRSRVLRHYCVILQNHDGHASVLQITSQPKDHRRDHIRIPNDGWDQTSGKAHWLELVRREVPYGQFRTARPQGMCPPATWHEIVRSGA